MRELRSFLAEHLLSARHLLPNALLALAIAGIVAGGWLLALAVVASVLCGVADEAIGDEKPSTPLANDRLCDASLYAAVPLLCLLAACHSIVAAGIASSPGGVRGPEVFHLSVATVLVGYQYALIGATVGHELTHRAESRVALACSCLVLAFTFNTGFTIFHVRGHHRLAGLWQDPACARRGETWTAFILRSTAGRPSAVTSPVCLQFLLAIGWLGGNSILWGLRRSPS